MDYKTIITISEKLNQAFADDLETPADWNDFIDRYPNIHSVLKFVNNEEDKFYGRSNLQ